jgi:hypothetical protein
MFILKILIYHRLPNQTLAFNHFTNLVEIYSASGSKK